MLYNNEVWKFVENSNVYQISNLGRFKNIETNNVYRPRLDRYGYLKLSFKNNGKLVYKTIHRLVAEAFIPNLENKPQVNHINGVKTDNNVNNLEWATAAENVNHSILTDLNTNHIAVLVKDIETGVTTGYQSIKNFGKYLGIYPSTIVPLIKNSERFPILGRYVVTLLYGGDSIFTDNTKNFGRKIFVFDAINGQATIYPSILLASYYTGIRVLSNITKWQLPFEIAGYYFGFSFEGMPLEEKHDIETLFKIREEYLSRPYAIRQPLFSLYNYYTKEQWDFKDIGLFTDFINTLDPIVVKYDKQTVSQKLGDGQKRSRTGLIKGYGLKSDLVDFEWFPYNEEVIISSRCGFKAPIRIYRVTIENKTDLVFGTVALCNLVGYVTDKNPYLITVDEVLKFCNIPNINIARLNKPI